MKLRILLISLVLLIVIPAFAQDDRVDPTELDLSGTPAEICEAATPAIEPENRTFSEAADILEDDIDYRAVMCTSAGAIYIDLLEGVAPRTVNNFIFLAEQNYYNNTIFHRVIEDFMAQGGDPTGTGTGGPGYQFADEFVGYVNFDRPGLLAMANSGPSTNGSQFFITTAETPWLNGAHTIFGAVLAGQAESVDTILLRDPAAGGDASTLDAVVIIRDPELVDSEYETPEIATSEDFVSSIDTLSEGDFLPGDVRFDGAETLTTEEVAALAQEDQVEDYAAFLEEYSHDYRVSAELDNDNCNADYYFTLISYAVDAFDSAENASAALEDEFLPAYYEALGYTKIESDDTGYSAYYADADVCGQGEVALIVDIQRGRYIANISVIYSASMYERFDELNLARSNITTIAPLFEGVLGEAYRSEVR